MAKLYYSTYICQLWLWDSKHMSDKAIKGLKSIGFNVNGITPNKNEW